MKTTFDLVKKYNEEMRSYHNTAEETGKDLAKNTAKAIYQDEFVYNIFKAFPESSFQPNYIWEAYFSHGNENGYIVPEWSIRRAFSNLQKRGLIEKTGEKVMGMYGRKINLWRLTK